MGYSILELVLRRLRERNFVADVAYPGQKFPKVAGPVAAVHIEKVDRANQTVTVEVNIICPAAMGGTECEVEALRATEVLRLAGAVCVQNGCTYDGVGQLYVVAILATFTAVTEPDSCTVGPGFTVLINEVRQPFVETVSAVETSGAQVQYVMGESLPVGAPPGSQSWTIRLEERIPSGGGETTEPNGLFILSIVSALKREDYYGCRWTSIKREYDRKGLLRIREGVAMLREEESLG